jgi:hypothetical protein
MKKNKVTAAMIEAGVEALRTTGDVDTYQLVEIIYRAMAKAASREGTSAGPPN